MSDPHDDRARPPAAAEDGGLQFGDRRTFRWTFSIVVAVLLVASAVRIEFDPAALFSARARENAAHFAAEGWPPRGGAESLLRLIGLGLDTVAIAAVGTAIAALIGLPLGVLGSRSAVLGSLFVTGDAEPSVVERGVWLAARVVGGFLRSIPEVIWAILFVPFAGLGPAPAVIAIGLAYGGMLAKVYSEQLETVDARPVTALESAGAGRFAAFAFGILPQASGEMTSYTAYRFECAVRASALMGFVGAGGLGQQIEFSHLDGNYGEMVSGVLVLMGFVFAIEFLSDQLKRRFA